VIALDKYDGKLWTLEDNGKPASDLRRPALEATNEQQLVQRFDIRDADPHWLPAAYRPVEVNLEHALVVPDSATMYLKPNSPLTDINYQVTSEIPTFSERQKEASPPVTDAAFRRYLDLPVDFPGRVQRLARAITANAFTPWDRASALATYLNRDGGFVYNVKVARSHTVATLEDFLFDTKEGYCEQFASAFAAMARSIGLPTRIAVGYSYGSAENGVWHVRNEDAHAWPEVYFTGLGWLPLEPTPGRGANAPGGTGDPTQRPAAAPLQSDAPTTAPSTAPGSSTPGSLNALRGPNAPGLSVDSSVSGTPHHTSRVTQVLIALGILVLVAALGALVFLAFLVGRAVRRSWRRRHATDPRDRVFGAWAEALDHLAEAGVEPKRSATPVEFALRHAPAHGAGDAGPALMDLAALQTAALFAPQVPSADDAETAWQKTDAIDHIIGHQISRLTRWRRRLDPRRERDDDRLGAPA
jgi:transglutaminase-like putative cysteine protease